MHLETGTIDWDTVWENVFQSSKNPNHQLIHYKICHRTYLTPRKRHKMGLAPNPDCTFCNHGVTGTLLHVLWECPDVQRFWVKVVDKMSDLIGRKFPLDPALLLLNDDSRSKIAEVERKLWLAGMTAAKKIIVLRWLPPHQLSIKHWLQALLEVIYLEWSSARINNSKPQTLQMWGKAAEDVTKLLS